LLWILTTRRSRATVEQLREFIGGEFRRRVRSLPYGSIRLRRALPGGAYVFADLERMGRSEVDWAARVARQIRSVAPDAVLLNDPSRVCCRYELLSVLHDEGVNSFRAYRPDAHASPRRWPVFLRGEHDHAGAATDLLFGPDELDAALRLKRIRRLDRSGLLVVEFADTKSPDGLYRKYSVFRVGDRIIPRHLIFGRHWMVKLQEPPGPEAIAEERAFVEAGPDDEVVRGIFERAGIQYGRIDYSRSADRIEVWEINTNPTVINRKTIEMTSRWPLNREVIPRIADALLDLAKQGAGRPGIPLRGVPGVQPRWWWPG